MSPRTIANRAEVYAMQLRRLADDLSTEDVARARSVIDADRAESLGAGERLLASYRALPVYDAGRLAPFTWSALPLQLDMLRAGHDVEVSALRGWAAKLETYALAVDP